MYDARARTYLARFLADAFLAGVWKERAAGDRAARALDRRPPWLRPVAREVLAAYHRPPSDRPRELARFIERLLSDLPGTGDPPPSVRRWLIPSLAMVHRPWPVPELNSNGELAERLELTVGELAWLADVRGLERSAPDERLRHYRYRTLPRAGGVPRLTERPKERLKRVQRWILHELLDVIPAHDAAHGFTRGRSAAGHAARHRGQGIVIRLDLRDFFATVSAGRVYGIFRTAGYPEPVAHTLTALTTNVVPPGVWETVAQPRDPRAMEAYQRLRRRLAGPHLPQGAPSSPALANLAAFGLDRRLSGLAASLRLTYTRYADDLTFSGAASEVRDTRVLLAAIDQITREEGFSLNARKTAVITRAGRQQVCGIVVNERLNVPRTDYDRLRATLHNVAERGPLGENRGAVDDFRAHLAGRIAWVASLNPQRGERLWAEFGRITWTSAQ
jgi:RNA-directed DNA polymerase